MKFSRRRFIAVSTVLASALAVGRRATCGGCRCRCRAETDANAQALGYKADAGRVDHAKYPKFHAGDACAELPVLPGQGRRHDGACAIFGGKQVNAKGWCNSYTKKA